MRVGIVVFPGSNCDHDAWYAVNQLGHQGQFLWHGSEDLEDSEAIILPGGFSYGDYLRCGALARFSPVLRSIRAFAAEGGRVLGICNGFQILTEAGLLPGALIRNSGLRYVCKPVDLVSVTAASLFTSQIPTGTRLRMPIAHGEGCYVAAPDVLDRLEAEDRVVFRYVENPNGSLRNIAGILNEGRNILGMMPHPERASDPLMGSTAGSQILGSFLQKN